MTYFKKTKFVFMLVTVFVLIFSVTAFAGTEDLKFVDYISESGSIDSVAVDDEGNIFMSFNDKNYIKKYDNRGTLIDTWGNEDGSAASDNGFFNSPCGIVVNEEYGSEYVYVADKQNNRIQKLTTDGQYVEEYNYEVNSPVDLAFDSLNNMYVVFDGVSLLMKRDGESGEWSQMPSIAYGEVVLGSQSKVVVAAGDNIYVTNGDDLYINNEPIDTGEGGFDEPAYTTDGICKDIIGIAYNSAIEGIFIDEYGNIYISGEFYDEDESISEYLVKKFDSSFNLIASYGGEWSNTNEALLNRPGDIVVDSYGNIFVSDWGKLKLMDLVSPSVVFTPDRSTDYVGNINVTVSYDDSFPSSGQAEVTDCQYMWSTTNGAVEFDENKIFILENGISTKMERMDIGTYYLHVKLEDKAGNEGLVVSDGYLIDKKGPEISVTPDNGYNAKPDYAVKINISDDNDLDMNSLKYVLTLGEDKLDPSSDDGFISWTSSTGSSITSTSIDINLSDIGAQENGEYYLWVYGEDEFGNDTYTESYGYTINKELEVVDISSIGRPTAISGLAGYHQDYEIDLTTLEGDNVQMYYQWTDSPLEPDETSDKWVLTDGENIKFFEEGNNEKFSGIKYFHAKCLVDGSIYYDYSEFLIDNEGAEITIAPEGMLLPAKSVSSHVEVIDLIDGEIDEFQAKWVLKTDIQGGEETWNESVNYSNEDITTSSSISIDDTSGEYILFIKAVDGAGNESISHSNVFMVDNQSPLGSIEIANKTVTQRKVEINLDISDNMSENNDIKYSYSTDYGVSWSQWIPVNDGLELTLETNDKNQNIKVELKYMDQAGNISGIYSINDSVEFTPVGVITWVEYSSLDLSNENVTASLKHNGVLEILNNAGSYDHVFEENGVFYFEIRDGDGNEFTVKSQVYNIDKEVLTPELIVSETSLTNKNVMVTLDPREEISVINNEGSLSHEFEENGIFNFEIEDFLGNTAVILVEVKNIDKIAPELTYTLSEDKATKDAVIVEVKSDEDIIVDNNLGSSRRTFKDNGSFTFLVHDYAGNESILTVTVDNIDKTPPEVWIEYSNTEWTNDYVTATLNSNEEFTVVNNNGSTEHIFNENGRFYFKVSDEAGNQSMVEAWVRNIDKESPKLFFSERGHPIYVVNSIDFDLDDFSVRDNLSGCSKDDTDINYGDFDISNTGEYTVQYLISDNAGNETLVERIVTVVAEGELKIFINGSDVDSEEFLKIEGKNLKFNILNSQGDYRIKWKTGKHSVNSMKYKSNIEYIDSIYLYEKGWNTMYFQDQERNTRLVQLYVY